MQRLSRFIFCLLLWSGGARAATNDLGLGFQATPTPAIAGQLALFTLTVTNQSNQILFDVFVDVEVTGPLTILTATNSLGPTTNTLKTATFYIAAFTNLQSATLSYVGLAPTFGTVVHSINLEVLNVSTNSAFYFTEVIAGTAGLGINFSGVPGGAVVNDLVGYQLLVTNRGPDTATGVVVTNALPPGLRFVSVAPADLPHSVSGNNLRLELGSLTNGGSSLIGISVQPTNAGTLSLSARVDAPGFVNPAPTNSLALATLVVSTPTVAGLRATILSAQVFNPQNGLMEQRIELKNTGSNTVTSARVVVAGLSNGLFNATGTNNGTPFVDYPAPFAPQRSVEFVLQYFSPTRQPGPNPVLTAFSVPRPVVPMPSGTAVAGAQVQSRVDGSVLLAFPATTGSRYGVIYSDTLAFTNARPVQPYLIAPGSQVQWLDQGPPGTLAPPGEARVRFYRVVQLPSL